MSRIADNTSDTANGYCFQKGGPCADAIQFFAYAGPRLNEAKYIFGRDCNFTKGEIIIRGDAETGTKNWEIRRVPMIPEMRKLLQRLKDSIRAIR